MQGFACDRPGELRASLALVSAALCGLLSVAAAGCSSGPTGVVTSSQVVPNMTLQKFTAECDAKKGRVEIHSHCGGENSCKGMSYDENTQVLTQHTCRATNTCAGYSCIIPG